MSANDEIHQHSFGRSAARLAPPDCIATKSGCSLMPHRLTHLEINNDARLTQEADYKRLPRTRVCAELGINRSADDEITPQSGLI